MQPLAVMKTMLSVTYSKVNWALSYYITINITNATIAYCGKLDAKPENAWHSLASSLPVIALPVLSPSSTKPVLTNEYKLMPWLAVQTSHEH